MAEINMDKILMSNPHKRFLITFNNMKDNYCVETARELYDTYAYEDIDFVLEHMDDIVKDGYYGVPFLDKLIKNQETLYPLYSQFSESVMGFINRNYKKMTDEQKGVYTEYANNLLEKMDSHKHTIFMTEFAIDENPDLKHDIDDLISNIHKAKIYENSDTEEGQEYRFSYLTETMKDLKNISNPELFLSIAPYIVEDTNNAINIKNMATNIFDMSNGYNEQKWDTFVRGKLTLESLIHDDAYIEAFGELKPSEDKMLIESMIDDDIFNHLDVLTNKTITTNDLPVIGLTTESAVDNVFINIGFLDTIYKDVKESYKEVIESASSIVTDRIEALNLFREMYDGDISDSYEDELLTEFVHSFDYGSIDYYAESLVDFTDNDELFSESIVTKATNKMEEINAKASIKKAERAKKMDEIRLAGKSIAKAPKASLDDAKQKFRDLDEKDDNRRKEKMLTPGNRNQVINKFKKAILYGGAALAAPLTIPLIMYFRHLSKNKDRRIRKELEREIQNEIDITSEKINDASAEGKKQEKYQLMRIKSKLEKELLRVKTNSKFV